jgi:hypothetical protein
MIEECITYELYMGGQAHTCFLLYKKSDSLYYGVVIFFLTLSENLKSTAHFIFEKMEFAPWTLGQGENTLP